MYVWSVGKDLAICMRDMNTTAIQAIRTIQMIQIPGPRLIVGANAWGLPGGGCCCLELTDALHV